MRNLLLFINKYNAVFFFVLLEVISITLIVNYNDRQKDIFLYSSNLFVGKVNDKSNDFVRYLNLDEKNIELKNENALIIQKYFNSSKEELFLKHEDDSILNRFFLIPATVCNKSIKFRNNRFTLDKGSNEGIKKGMGVLSTKGLVGVVRKVNSDYSSVVPLNNTVSRISSMISNKGYFGILKWKPYDFLKSKLESIPKHAHIEIGDSVITSGFSTIFPKGILIGTVENVNLEKGSNYYDIDVKLINNLALEDDVYVIGDKKKELKLQVEE